MSLTWADSTGSAVTTAAVVNTPYTGTFTFLDNDVRAMYVDWDDGVSNKKTDANYQWGRYTESPTSVTLVHTYNATGAFKPVVQTINSRGIVSRYYSNESSNADVTPFAQNTAISGVTVTDTTATAIMRVENTTVDVGIDNSIMAVEGPKEVYIAVAPTLTRTELTGTIKQVQVSVEGIVHRNKYDSVTGVEGTRALGTDVSQETTIATIDFTTAANQYGVYDFWSVVNDTENGAYSKILKVTYDSCKATGTTAANPGTDYTANEVFNRLKIFLVVKAADGKYYPITYVSAGSPIRSVEDSGRYSTLDMGQSRAAASNISISNYRYDNGKMWFNPTEQWALSTDILGTDTKQTDSVKPSHYSYLVNPYGLNTIATAQEVFGDGAGYVWYQNAGTTADAIREDSVGLDNYGRLYDQYYNVRNSVEASSTSGSIVTTNQPEVFLVEPCPNWSSPEDITESGVDNYSTEMKNNGSGSGVKLASLNGVTQADILNQPVTTQEKEFIILAFESKTNNIFINATNYANTLMSGLSGFDNYLSGLKIAGVEYLHIDDYQTIHQNVYWKPVEFTDTTRITREVRDAAALEYTSKSTSLAKSGYISFDMPSDWGSASIQDLCGGVYNTASDIFSACTASGAADVVCTGTMGSNAFSSGYGNINSISSVNIRTQMEAAFGAGTSGEDVGRFKYGMVVTSGTASGSFWWLADAPTGNGWNGTTAVKFLAGTTHASAAFNTNYTVPVDASPDGVEFSVRRINIYDVIGGASKVFAINSGAAGINNTVINPATLVGTGNAQLITVGGQEYNAGTSWFKNRYCLTDADITGSSWATNAKYILKITLSGATNAGTANNPCPEIWNIFDAMQGDSAIIKGVDDSAYNLNSLPITSGISIGRKGNYFKAITRLGKVHIVKTGIGLEQIGFSSVALGDETSTTAFADHGPSTLYGHLHTIRGLQSEAVPVYWDEKQKDGTFVRVWGIITDVNETRGTGGPRAIVNYTFNMAVKEIALIKNNGILFTDIYPLGGIPDEKTYS